MYETDLIKSKLPDYYYRSELKEFDGVLVFVPQAAPLAGPTATNIPPHPVVEWETFVNEARTVYSKMQKHLKKMKELQSTKLEMLHDQRKKAQENCSRIGYHLQRYRECIFTKHCQHPQVQRFQRYSGLKAPPPPSPPPPAPPQPSPPRLLEDLSSIDQQIKSGSIFVPKLQDDPYAQYDDSFNDQIDIGRWQNYRRYNERRLSYDTSQEMVMNIHRFLRKKTLRGSDQRTDAELLSMTVRKLYSPLPTHNLKSTHPRMC